MIFFNFNLLQGPFACFVSSVKALNIQHLRWPKWNSEVFVCICSHACMCVPIYVMCKFSYMCMWMAVCVGVSVYVFACLVVPVWHAIFYLLLINWSLFTPHTHSNTNSLWSMRSHARLHMHTHTSIRTYSWNTMNFLLLLLLTEKSKTETWHLASASVSTRVYMYVCMYCVRVCTFCCHRECAKYVSVYLMHRHKYVCVSALSTICKCAWAGEESRRCSASRKRW